MKSLILALKTTPRFNYIFWSQAGNTATCQEGQAGHCHKSLASLDPAFNPEGAWEEGWNFQAPNSLRAMRLTGGSGECFDPSSAAAVQPTWNYLTSNLSWAPPTVTAMPSCNLSHYLPDFFISVTWLHLNTSSKRKIKQYHVNQSVWDCQIPVWFVAVWTDSPLSCSALKTVSRIFNKNCIRLWLDSDVK